MGRARDDLEPHHIEGHKLIPESSSIGPSHSDISSPSPPTTWPFIANAIDASSASTKS
jgi:hypothetical protein